MSKTIPEIIGDLIFGSSSRDDLTLGAMADTAIGTATEATVAEK
ncbi:hypothetical protein V4P56_06060 [Bartonella sp. B35(2025)]